MILQQKSLYRESDLKRAEEKKIRPSIGVIKFDPVGEDFFLDVSKINLSNVEEDERPYNKGVEKQ